MKQIRLRHSNGVNLNRIFSAKLLGGGRGFNDALAMETFSNTESPTLRTISGFVVISQICETR